ncbi:Adenine nucleotide alpha hydrolases-like superfamily protein isoform 1 [Capsicum annuum]|nr:Adenine nucleotide alpha hydrolases-like superfamily protein isoform 1 [Capsicum annuum]
MAKTSKTESSSKKKKMKKSSKTGPKSKDMKLKPPKENPFEAIWSRRKFDILGKKRKGEQRRIGEARSSAIEKRKKTLLKEYEQSGKSSMFVDKRIGENDEGLGEFDKAIMRSQRERQMKLKKNKYNLSDEDEEDFDFGVSLGRDDFDEEVPFDEDEEDYARDDKSAILGQLNSHGSQNAQPGPVEAEENWKKSKKEVMEEIIQKSKFFKAQKAKDREENDELTEQLDKDFTSLVNSKALLSLTQPDKINALKALVNKNISVDNVKKDEVADAPRKGSIGKEKPDTYEMLVSEMAMDIRARPSNRTKTPEEIVQEEKERLELLEKERQKRMAAVDDESDEDGNASDDDSKLVRDPRTISGDDLGDDLEEAPRNKLGWIGEILRRKESELESEDAASTGDSDSEEDDGEDEGSDDGEEEGSGNGDDEGSDEYEEGKTQTIKDWEQSDDDIIDDAKKVMKIKDLKGVDVKGKEVGTVQTKKEKTTLKHPQSELPYTIEAPKTLEEFTSLIDNCSDDQVIEAIRRIRTFNAITVAAENKKKMQVFYGVLLQYFAVLANKKPLNFKLLNLLVKPLMEMSAATPYFAAICARQRLQRIRTQFCEDLKHTGKSSWPSLKTVFLLRLWSMIFPCSDFRHCVMTPAILLMCEYLMRCPIICGRDIAIASFLCSLLLSVTKQSQKFCPEAIVFLQTLLMAALDREQRFENLQLNNLMEIKELGPLLCIRSSNAEMGSLDFLELMDLPEDSQYFDSDNYRASILVTVLETLQGFVNVYKDLISFPEIFMPISKLLCKLSGENHIPGALREKIEDVSQLIDTKAQEHHMLRQPLKMRKKKPVPIRMLNPKFEENYVKGRDYDPDRERAEKKKLKKRIKEEAKGAARELRKDKDFLAKAKEREKALLAEEKAEKYGKALAFLQEQEHAFKSGQLGKGRKRRR